MAYTKTVWKDYPNTTTKMTAQKLNNIEDGIEALDTGKAPKASPTFTGTVTLPSSTSINGNTVLTQDDLIDTGWQYPTMLNGWVNKADNQSPIRYRKVGQIVYISGVISSGTFNTTIFTLPVGYRPAGEYMCSVVRAKTGIAFLHINYMTSGGVVVENLTGTNAEISFHGISYVAES